MDAESISENPFFWLFVEGVGVILYFSLEQHLGPHKILIAWGFIATVGIAWFATSGLAKRHIWNRSETEMSVKIMTTAISYARLMGTEQPSTVISLQIRIINRVRRQSLRFALIDPETNQTLGSLPQMLANAFGVVPLLGEKFLFEPISIEADEELEGYLWFVFDPKNGVPPSFSRFRVTDSITKRSCDGPTSIKSEHLKPSSESGC